MKTAIMQPYFFPYIGYFQLINAVDTFVLYDNIQYTKKGWFNRNRFLQNEMDTVFTIPLKKDSDYLNVIEREISKDFNKQKLIAQFKNAYNKAPYKNDVIELIETIINNPSINLFDYIYQSIKAICNYLNINTRIVVSSKIDVNHKLMGQDKVVAICKALNTNIYINSLGGKELYKRDFFLDNGINLSFIKTNEIKYKQFNSEFIPWLSIIDVMMFNSKEKIILFLQEFELNDN